MPTDPISVAALSLSTLGDAAKALTALRERAKSIQDVDIENQISALYDKVLSLKDVILGLLDENRDLLNENINLKRQLKEQQHPPTTAA